MQLMSRIVLVGAGHVHLGLFARIPSLLRKGHQVTVISQSPTYCYSGMAPGVLGGKYDGSDITLDIRAIVEGNGVPFTERKVIHIDPVRRELTLETREIEPYDIVSFNIGSSISAEGMILDPQNTIPAKPIFNFFRIRETLEQLAAAHAVPRIIIAGGGPAGLEIATNLCRLAERRGCRVEVTLVSSAPLLPSLPPGARRSAYRALKEAGVRMLEYCRLEAFDGGRARIQGGPDLDADLAILAVGIRPPNLFRDSGLRVAADGGLLVNRHLQCPEFPEIFGGGDCVTPLHGPAPRIGVVACRQNPVITRNIFAFPEGRKLAVFRQRKSYLQIFNLGRSRALMVKGRLWYSGRAAFRLKDAIDTRFIRRLRRSVNLPALRSVAGSEPKSS
jgi:NADH dehydrogenase FAD-containing subunit